MRTSSEGREERSAQAQRDSARRADSLRRLDSARVDSVNQATLVGGMVDSARLAEQARKDSAANIRNALRNGVVAAFAALPVSLRRTLTWDQGKEMAQHVRFTIETGLQVYFCDPRSLGSAVRTRTPTGCFASTSPSSPAWPASASANWMPSLPSSTGVLDRPSAG